MIEIFLSGIISGLVAGMVIILYSKYIHYKKVSKVITHVQDVLDQLQDKIIDARFEFDNNIIRAYNNDSDEFLAQGTSLDEINRNLEKRFPYNLFNVPQEQIDRAKKFSK